jgi:DNA-binding transcriptional ArsR family regulator
MFDLISAKGSRHETMEAMNNLDLLLHPVRIRIIHALSGAQVRTTAELADHLPDVSRATVYRHVALLVEGGILDVVAERRVRGAVERSYRLRGGRAVISREEAATMSKEQHRAAFASALAVLVAEFNAYLDSTDSDPSRDRVGYTQIPIWLSRRELADVQRTVVNAVAANGNNQRNSGRRPYLMSPIMFPLAEPGAGLTPQSSSVVVIDPHPGHDHVVPPA